MSTPNHRIDILVKEARDYIKKNPTNSAGVRVALANFERVRPGHAFSKGLTSKMHGPFEKLIETMNAVSPERPTKDFEKSTSAFIDKISDSMAQPSTIVSKVVKTTTYKDGLATTVTASTKY